MARQIKIIEAKDKKAYENKVNKFYRNPEVVINRAVYRVANGAYTAVIEYEKGV